MSTPDLVIRGRRVVLPDGVRPASVHVTKGRISSVERYEDVPPGCAIDDAGNLVLMPGIVDTHVHVNDPGRADWEGFDTATRAAAAGGVTTLMDMPLNSIPPTTTMAGLLAKAAAAENRVWVDVGLCGGVVPGNAGELRGLFQAGALAFKCFLAESGVDEFPHVTEVDLEPAMRALADIGAPLLVHAELPPFPDAAGTSRRYASYLASRPRTREDAAVELLTRLSASTGARTHVVHLSSADALAFVRRAREAGTPFSAETCPHYLHFTSESIADGATAFKCAPPIRERENRERLWAALGEGLIDQIVTDHSPSSPSLKCVDSGDFMAAWGGISSLQLGLPVIWSESRARGKGVEDVARWMCAAPARLVGLERVKGTIAPGADADLIFWDPDAVFRVDANALEHRHKLTPYDGQALYGVVRSTYLRGAKVFEHGKFVGTPRGRWLKRGDR
jgi:allantoinase